MGSNGFFSTVIAQKRSRGTFGGVGAIATRNALIRVCDEHASTIDAGARVTLKGLPEWFPEKQNAPGRITGSVSTNCGQEVDYSKIAPDASVCHGKEASNTT